MKSYKSMSSAEFYIECADVAIHLATQVIVIARGTAALFRNGEGLDDKHADAFLQFTMLPILEELGDILNSLDAADATVAWTDEMYEELHRRFPPNRTAS